jgi:hypothetical protein
MSLGTLRRWGAWGADGEAWERGNAILCERPYLRKTVCEDRDLVLCRLVQDVDDTCGWKAGRQAGGM